MKVISTIVDRHGRINDIELFDKDPGLEDHKKLDDHSITLSDVLDTYGEKVKKEAKRYTLFYDFKPYNSEEPILLALGASA